MIYFTATSNLRLVVEGPYDPPPANLLPIPPQPEGTELWLVTIFCSHCNFFSTNMLAVHSDAYLAEQAEAGAKPCPACNGTGEFYEPFEYGTGEMLGCQECRATGKVEVPVVPGHDQRLQEALGGQVDHIQRSQHAQSMTPFGPCAHSGPGYTFPAPVEIPTSGMPTAPPWYRPEGIAPKSRIIVPGKFGGMN